MSDDTTFTPAAGHLEWTPFYDFAIALLTRERRWRSALLTQTAAAPDDRVLREADFAAVDETEVIATVTGSMSLYNAFRGVLAHALAPWRIVLC